VGYVLANVPSSGVRSKWPRPVPGGVVFSELSKLLNQEDALSAPCLWGDSALHRRALAGAEVLRTGGTRYFDVMFVVCYT
jgi:hypothetical protein